MIRNKGYDVVILTTHRESQRGVKDAVDEINATSKPLPLGEIGCPA